MEAFGLIYLTTVYLIGLGIVLDQRQAWYWGVMIFVLSPVFVPNFLLELK